MIHILLEIFKKYTFQQKQILLIFCVALVVSGLGMRLFIMGDLASIQKNKVFLAKAISRNTVLTQTVSLSAETEKYRGALSGSKEASWMMEAVHRAAAETGLSVVSVAPQNAEKSDLFEKISLMVEGDGEYHRVGRFLELIENNKPWLFLDHLRLEKPASPGVSRRLKVYLILSAYHEIWGRV